MNKEKFACAIIEYSKNSKIGTHQLTHYFTDGRLIGILKIYDKLQLNINSNNKTPFEKKLQKLKYIFKEDA